MQRIQNFIERRVSKKLANWIFMRRVKWHAWRGQIEDVRIEES